jgi:hypothetical protein
MKGIAKSLGEMKIQLNLDANVVKKRSYGLKPKYKEKVGKELDQMLQVGSIVPVEESVWRKLLEEIPMWIKMLFIKKGKMHMEPNRIAE